MAADERNFRQAYYEKVGFKSVEEKRSLEILLKDKHLDLSKLRQFCLRFGVPAAHRNLVWKVLLGVLPAYANCHSYVMDQRRDEYADMVHALTVIRAIGHTAKHHTFVAVWQLQSGNLRRGVDTNPTDQAGFVAMLQSFMFFFSSDADVYWLTRQFYETTLKFRNDLGKLIEMTRSTLEREDARLYKHLVKHDVLDGLPFDLWFHCCFARVINDVALGKIWDKICAGSYKILMYVAIVMLTSLKQRLLKCNDLVGVMKHVNGISEDLADLIANKSIELWQQHGSPLTVYDKPKPS